MVDEIIIEEPVVQPVDPIAAMAERITALTAKVEALENAPAVDGVVITDDESTNIKNMIDAGNYAFAIGAIHKALVQ